MKEASSQCVDENVPRLKVQGCSPLYTYCLISSSRHANSALGLDPFFTKLQSLLLCICPSICSSQLCQDSYQHFSRPILKGTICGKKEFSGSCKRWQPVNKSKKTLGEFIRCESALTGCGLQTGVVSLGTTASTISFLSFIHF